MNVLSTILNATTIKFDGTTYACTDALGVVTPLLATDIQNFIVLSNSAITAINQEIYNKQTIALVLQDGVSAVNKFTAVNLVV